RLRAGAGRRVRHGDAEEQKMTPKTREAPGADEARAAPPCAMVIFGAAGDLTKRLLAPSLYDLKRAGRLAPQFQLVGVATTPLTTADWKQSLTAMMNEFVGQGGGEFQTDRLDATAWRWITERMTYLRGDVKGAEVFRQLGAVLSELDKKRARLGIISFIWRSPIACSVLWLPAWARRACS